MANRKSRLRSCLRSMATAKASASTAQLSTAEPTLGSSGKAVVPTEYAGPAVVSSLILSLDSNLDSAATCQTGTATNDSFEPGTQLLPETQATAPAAPPGFPLSPSALPETQPGRLVVSFERAFNQLLTDSLFHALTALYGSHDRAYARFYVLETIARVPYFAYVSVLHLYESFGWWRRVEFLKAHFDESVNETHHLMIMETLGGDRKWLDRFLAQHVAVGYFAFAVVCYMVSPRMAYHLSELVEAHAYESYDKFLRDHGEELKQLPAPKVAKDYYNGGNLYQFDGFSLRPDTARQRVLVQTLYDTFLNIRDDEAEHCKTMRACQEPPPAEKGSLDVDCSGVVDCAIKSSSAAARLSQAKGLDEAGC